MERQLSTQPLLPIELRELPSLAFSHRLSLCENQLKVAVAERAEAANINIIVISLYFIMGQVQLSR